MASFRSFLKDARGATAVTVSLALPVLALAVGGGIDLSRAAAAQQRIATAVELACSQASQEITYRAGKPNADPKADYRTVVTDITKTKLVNESITGVAVTTGIANQVITITAGGTSINAFGQVIGFEKVSLSVQRTCPIATPPSSGTVGKLLFSESFENEHNVASNSWTVLKNWNGWATRSTEGGIEINGIPQLSGNEIRFGNFFAELDSHCYVANCKTNSSMWREFTIPESGAYELRYWYISRVRNPAYGTRTICALQTDNATVWSDLNKATWEGQTNRIDVYFEKSPYKDVPPAANRVDTCVHTSQWTERVIKLPNLTKGAKHRIYFTAAEGRQDTYGGLIDYIRFCSGRCP